jgi:hypothetical protein
MSDDDQDDDDDDDVAEAADEGRSCHTFTQSTRDLLLCLVLLVVFRPHPLALQREGRPERTCSDRSITSRAVCSQPPAAAAAAAC